MTQLLESLKMAVAALTANKMRAVLTTLGVVIGITTVLLMGWALSGLDSALNQTLAIFGDDVLYIDKYDWVGGTDWIESRNRKNINYQQYLLVRERLRSAEYVIPEVNRGRAVLTYGDKQLTSGTTIVGTTSEYISVIGGALGKGRFFNEAENNAAAHLAVIAHDVQQNLFGDTDPIGRTMKIDGIPFTVIGTMPKRGALGADFVDNQIIIPLKRFGDMFGMNDRSITITVKAGGVDKMEDVKSEATGVMRQVRKLQPGEKNDFSVNTQEQFQEKLDQLRVVVWGVGLAMTGLSFLVGSIGIMNIMFVSVTERTKEIGIRKAVGATRRSILMQFLIEAVLLCCIGAVIGYGITAGLAYLVAHTTDVGFLSSSLPASQIGLAVIVSIVVGVLAGVIPAFRASRLDPVEALRAE